MKLSRALRSPVAVMLAVVLMGCIGRARSSAGEEPPHIASSDGLITRGVDLYAANCQRCHGDREGVGKIPNAPVHGPGGHTWAHSDQSLINIMRYGNQKGALDEFRRQMGIPEDAPRMPAWKDILSEDDMQAILAFLKTWWTPEQCAARRERFGSDEGDC